MTAGDVTAAVRLWEAGDSDRDRRATLTHYARAALGDTRLGLEATELAIYPIRGRGATMQVALSLTELARLRDAIDEFLRARPVR